MDAQAFWNVIGEYNRNTIIIQIMLLILTVIAVAVSYSNKAVCSAKLMLGIVNLFIGIMFFRMLRNSTDTEIFCFTVIFDLRFSVFI